MGTKLEGRKAYITNRDCIYYGEWGIIEAYIDGLYYIRIANGGDSVPVFARNEFLVKRERG